MNLVGMRGFLENWILVFLVNLGYSTAMDPPPCGIFHPDFTVLISGTGCRRFYQCEMGVLTIQECEPSGLYHHSVLGCGYEFQNCHEKLDMERAPDPWPAPHCDQRLPEYLMSSPRGCIFYYKCSNGTITENKCTFGKKFDPIHRVCAQSVACEGRPIPTTTTTTTTTTSTTTTSTTTTPKPTTTRPVKKLPCKNNTYSLKTNQTFNSVMQMNGKISARTQTVISTSTTTNTTGCVPPCMAINPCNNPPCCTQVSGAPCNGLSPYGQPQSQPSTVNGSSGTNPVPILFMTVLMNGAKKDGQGGVYGQPLLSTRETPFLNAGDVALPTVTVQEEKSPTGSTVAETDSNQKEAIPPKARRSLYRPDYGPSLLLGLPPCTNDYRIPSPKGCPFYFECREGVLSEKRCGRNEGFDRYSGRCGPSNAVRCQLKRRRMVMRRGDIRQ